MLFCIKLIHGRYAVVKSSEEATKDKFASVMSYHKRIAMKATNTEKDRKRLLNQKIYKTE